MTRTRVIGTRLSDALAMLLAVKVVASTIFSQAGVSAQGSAVPAWVGLAALYAAGAWICGAGPRLPRWAEPFARASMLFGALLCTCLARHFGAVAGSAAVHLFDWLALGACLVFTALAERR